MPEEALKNWDRRWSAGKKLEAEWNEQFEEYKRRIRSRRRSSSARIKAKLQPGWEKTIPAFPADKPVATRNAGQR